MSNHKFVGVILLLACIFGLSSRPTLAEADQPTHPNEQQQVIVTSPSQSASSSAVYWTEHATGQTRVIANNVETVQPGNEDIVDLILVLSDSPISEFQQALNQRNATGRQNTQVAVAEQANRLAVQQKTVLQQLQNNGSLRRTNRQFSYLLNGIALSAPMGQIEEIKRLPGVKAVFRDYQAHITLQDSVPLIGAPIVWAQSVNGVNLRGQGVRVAIIDTGIDYTHPDLGGCFGAGCRVIDGWDFVNNDNNPIDDNGHGTHIAGITAANGALEGVAPEASLLAYKVCDSGGSCSYSAIIAALERAANPDNNPATNDAVDVVNMSLGGPGSPDDALSMATNNAVAQGIIVVVAAGNAGSSYRTVGSPGAAQDALTVGATTKSDMITSFSSRGWVGEFINKPDLVAPGAAINSTYINHGYASLNGTSMATPHVAGAAALLVQAHPDWSPSMVKSSLMNSTLDLGLDTMTQGTGRMRVDQALNPSLIAEPGILSFGAIDIEQSLWTKTLSIQIHNPTNSTQSYQLAVAPGLPAGLSASLSSNQITVGAGQTASVDLSLTADNQVLPFPTDPSSGYSGAVQISNATDVKRVAFMVIKSAILRLLLDGSEWPIFIHDRQGHGNFIEANQQTVVNVPINAGTYDLVAGYQDENAFVFKENFHVTNITTITLSASQATNVLTTKLKQFDGQETEIVQRDFHYLLYKPSQHSLAIIGDAWSGSALLYSNMSNNYFNETCSYLRNYWSNPNDQTVYDLCYFVDGISASQTQQLDAQNLKKMNYQIEPEPGATQATVSMGYRFNASLAMGGWNFAIDWKSLPFTRTFYHTPPSHPLAMTRDINAEQKDANNQNLATIWSSRLRFSSSSLTMDTRNFNPVDGNWANEQLTSTATDWKLTMSPTYWAGHFANTDNEIRLGANALWGTFNGTYLVLRDQHQNTMWDQPIHYTVTSGIGTTTGILTSNASFPVQPGTVATEFTYHTPFLGALSIGKALATFNTNQSDKNPPLISELKVMDAAGLRTTAMTTTGSIAVRVQDNIGIAAVELAVNYNDGQGWRILNTNVNNGFYAGTVPAYSASSTTSAALRIVVTDVNGNQLRNEISPAFTIQSLGDLAITNIVFDSNCKATFTVANLGGSDVTASFPFTASQLYVPAWGSGSQTGWSATIFGLGAGQTITQSWLQTFIFGTQISAFVDPQNQIAEANEGNNHAFFPVPAHCQYIPSDLGDAPDKTNHTPKPMNAYTGVVANYPTTYDSALSGTTGPIHKIPYQDSWFGAGVSGEKDADLTPDGDGNVTNLAPLTNSANSDKQDNGIVANTLSLPNCATTTFKYSVKVVGIQRTRYVNVWFDFNRDGDWQDVYTCISNGSKKTVAEWAVQNQSSSLIAGSYTITTPAFWSGYASGSSTPIWMRMMLSEGKATVIPNTTKADGRGPLAGYQYGETEDYLITLPNIISAAEVDAIGSFEEITDGTETASFMDSEAVEIVEMPEEQVAEQQVYPEIEGSSSLSLYLPLVVKQ